ncbi:hypothetical protein Poli38472_008794 [Pythium oligandrum]|uniref:Signal recognition particle receptor subunit beta n=1 Tax=Pythium oligandrum TaxID=41045 RepID=A0A8K1FBH7_PYTOL|nr:hypothetical protein Poli38472_008794 [Pythium oligandrum]|eukprot:TMW56146.1 hypothetical protein Poli38472_008794 [Pythium oligandrum]
MSSIFTAAPFGRLYGYPSHLVVLLAGLVALYIYLLVSFCMHMRSLGVGITGNKKKMTMLLGPRGAGKTALFHQLRDGRFVETVTSMTELEGKFAVHDRYNTINFGAHLSIVDYPGHERLRSRVADYYPVTGCVVFVVDAADQSFRKAAEYLYDIFSNAKFNDLAPRMLIACNKTDIKSAATVEVVKEALEKELTKLKKTRSSLETEGEEDTSVVPVGRDGVAFEFAVDAPCEVTFVKSSFKAGDVDDVATFVLKN